MPQISLYANEQDYLKIEQAAKASNKSISSFVIEIIISQIEPKYSKEFEKLFGSISEDSLKIPTVNDFSDDFEREIL